MRHTSSTIAAVVAGSANPNPNHRTKQRRHKDRDRYADAGRSAREAMDRFRAAEAQARADGRKMPPSCARVMLALVEQITTWSRRNDAFPISTPPSPRYPAGGLVESTGLARNTVRKALGLLADAGCITITTPENVKGCKTGATLIAFPVVDRPAEGEDEAEDVAADTWPTRSVQTDPHPVSPDARGTRSVQTDPLTRSYEKEVRARAKREAPDGQPPGGRPGGRPSPSLDGGPPPTPTPMMFSPGLTPTEWWHSMNPAERERHGAFARMMGIAA